MGQNKISHYFKFISKFYHNRIKLSIFLLGLSLSLAFAPFNLGFVCLVIIPILFNTLEKTQDLKKVFIYSFLFCFGFFISGIYWICNSLLIDVARYGWLIPFAITLIPALMALYFAGIYLLYKFLINYLKLHSNSIKILLFSIAWLVFDILRSNLFTGFSWNLLGYIWLFNLNFAQLANIFGVYGLSFLACLISLTGVLLLSKKSVFHDKIFGFLLLVLLPMIFFYGKSQISLASDKLTKIAKVRMVQANIKQQDKWLESEKYQNFFKHINLTKSQPLDNIDVVIWSETSIPYALQNSPRDENLSAIASELSKIIPQNGYLVSGAIRYDQAKDKNYQVWNSFFVFNHRGLVQYYDKQHLVPFGEYIPLHNYLSFLFIDQIVDKITGGGFGFSSGQGNKNLQLGNFSINPLICYEVIFSGELLDRDKKIPDFFINITNDSWFGNSTGPYQHLAMAQMRAIEYGRALIRVAQTGVSANINSFGKITEQIALNEEAIVDSEVFGDSRITLYAKYSHWPLVVLIIFMLIIFWPKKIINKTR